MIDELERVVPQAQGAPSFIVTWPGEAGNRELRRATQVRIAGKGKSTYAQLLDNVAAGECILSGREFRIAQVAEAEFIERGRPDDVRVAERQRLIADKAVFAVPRKGPGIEAR